MITYCQGCTDNPSEYDKSRGVTCQGHLARDYYEVDMTGLCTKSNWIGDMVCGKTCALFGVATNPYCTESKKNKRYSLVIL